jgi:hypothetical protein
MPQAAINAAVPAPIAAFLIGSPEHESREGGEDDCHKAQCGKQQCRDGDEARAILFAAVLMGGRVPGDTGLRPGDIARADDQKQGHGSGGGNEAAHIVDVVERRTLGAAHGRDNIAEEEVKRPYRRRRASAHRFGSSAARAGRG